MLASREQKQLQQQEDLTSDNINKLGLVRLLSLLPEFGTNSRMMMMMIKTEGTWRKVRRLEFKFSKSFSFKLMMKWDWKFASLGFKSLIEVDWIDVWCHEKGCISDGCCCSWFWFILLKFLATRTSTHFSIQSASEGRKMAEQTWEPNPSELSPVRSCASAQNISTSNAHRWASSGRRTSALIHASSLTRRYAYWSDAIEHEFWGGRFETFVFNFCMSN